jgi:hypothetical protein
VGLAFKDASAGKSIFEGWRNKLGRIDDQEQLRISIVRGIDAANPHCYRVVIGSNMDILSSEPLTQMVLVSRINRMDPKNSDNLDGFLNRFKSVGRFFLAPAHFISEESPPELYLDLRIEKKQLTVRPAWQIGPNDPDSIAIEKDDNPIIPADVLDVPVGKLLKKKRSR